MATEKISLAKAITRGLHDAMEADPKVVLIGEDIGANGGVFRVTEGLQKDFGPDRVIDPPLAESGIAGVAVGLAYRGYRPVAEIQFDGFVYPAFDQIVSQMAKMHARSLGAVQVPMVVRIPYGGGIGAVEHHSESNEGYFCMTPGLKVVSPSTPEDGYWMIRQAIESNDPIMFFEPKRRYHERVEADLSEASKRDLHSARVVREGTDATVLCWGPMVKTCTQSAAAAAEEGKSLEIIDARCLSPLDMPAIIESVKKTRRLVVVHEAHRRLGLGAEIAAQVQEECFYHLEAPVLRCTGFNVPYPPSKFEEEYLPNLDRILDTVDQVLAY